MEEGRSAKKSSIFDILRSKSKEESRLVTVREEKKSFVRVMKARPRAIKHMSEVLESRPVPAGGFKITEAAAERVVSAPEPPKSPKAHGAASPAMASRAFTCVECGARMLVDSDACPRCHSKYLMNLSPDALAELDRAILALAEGQGYGDNDADDFAFDEFPIIHFDAMDGVINYLEHQDGESDFVLECSRCDTLIQIDIDRCPLCGTRLEVADVGLVNLIRDGEFEDWASSEMECPQCGDRVTLQDGKCPSCECMILGSSPGDSADRKIIPLVRAENVVFIHIDLETGDLNYLQRHLNKTAIEHMSIQLDGVGNGSLDEDWQGLSRI